MWATSSSFSYILHRSNSKLKNTIARNISRKVAKLKSHYRLFMRKLFSTSFSKQGTRRLGLKMSKDKASVDQLVRLFSKQCHLGFSELRSTLSDPLNLFNFKRATVYYIIIGFILLITGKFDQLVINCIGLYYPAFMSLKALESRDPLSYEKWLVYWIVYASFHVIDCVSNLLFFWNPMYHVSKIFFLLWLYSPNYQGACILYRVFLRPLFIQYEPIVEMYLRHLKYSIDEKMQSYSSQITQDQMSIANEKSDS